MSNKFSAQFIRKIRPKVQAVLERDVNPLINEVNAEFSCQLSQVFSFDIPIAVATQFPCIYVAGKNCKPDQSADDSYINNEVDLQIEMSVVDVDYNRTLDDIELLMLAVDRALRNMAVEDWMGAITAINSAPKWEVIDHQQYDLLVKDDQYRRDAVLIARFQFMEL